MKTEDFLDILEQRQLVSESILNQLRAKVEKGDHRVTPKSVLKYLVKKDLVTQAQARALLNSTLDVNPRTESSILGLSPLPEETAEPSRPKAKKPSASPPPEEPEEEEIATLAPIEEETARKSKKSAKKSSSKKNSREPVSAIPEEPVTSSLDDLGDSELDATQDTAFSEPAATGGKWKKKKAKESEWDSSLLLLGGGGLVLLLLTGAVVGFLLYREDADAILAEAAEYFEGGSYTQAIKQYERFVEGFPNHPEYSTGRVKLGMARLWKASNTTSDYEGALATAQEVLDNIEDEEAFQTEAQRDLASLLPKIAAGLAQQAEQAEAPERIAELVQKANTALALCANTKYIPKSLRNEVAINEVELTLQRVERAREEQQQLGVALEEIESALQGGEIADAYAVHKQVVEDYPGLINNKQLAEKVKEISAAEAEVVRFHAESKDALTTEHESPIVASLALASKSGSPAENISGNVAVRIDGALYSLAASDGSVNWHRFVGIAPEAPPVAALDGSVLIVDVEHRELCKLDSESGKLVWRFPLEHELSQPTIIEERIFLGDASGKLHVLDLETGRREGYVQFSQPLSVPPTLGTNGRLLYVVGEQSSLYTISLDDFSCRAVFYMGQSKASVRVSPEMLLDNIALAINTGITTSTLRLLQTDSEGIPTEIVATKRLEGLVRTRLLVDGRRLAVLTNEGQVMIYEVSTRNGSISLIEVANREPDRGPPIDRFGLLQKGHVWMAGMELNKLAILPTENRLPVRDLEKDYSGDTFDHPLHLVDDLLIHVRRPGEEAGAVVGAMQTESGQEVWQTSLAVPLAGTPSVNPEELRIHAISANGAGYSLDRQAMARRVQDEAQPLRRGSHKLPTLTSAIAFEQGAMVAASTGRASALYFRPDPEQSSSRTIELPTPLSSEPIAWENRLVAPTKVGQVFLYSLDGTQLGSPFQPALEQNSEIDWLRPAVYGEGEESRLVISDGHQNIYLLRYQHEPREHLEGETQSDIAGAALNTPLAVLNNWVCAGTVEGGLARFELPALDRLPDISVGGEIVWGPFSVDQQVVFATASDELIAVDTAGEVLWRQPFAHGPPAGTPLPAEGELLVLWREGGLSRIGSDGQEVAFIDIAPPTRWGPVRFRNRLVIASATGTLFVVNSPE